jgi:hypothetical protein
MVDVAPRPHQDLSVLIHRKALGNNEFCLEVFEAGVIEAELALQSAIGDTATVVEQLNDLINNLVKVHDSPSPCVSLHSMSQCCGSAYQTGPDSYRYWYTLLTGWTWIIYDICMFFAHFRSKQ